LALPTDLPLAAPSALIHRRPDILAADAQLHAASAAIGIATAALYPSLTVDAVARVRAGGGPAARAAA
ncbi:MAG TPA: TolC family protein, partial [Duganella sp.]|nr:TolC family protein [Duganella sp.]